MFVTLRCASIESGLLCKRAACPITPSPSASNTHRRTCPWRPHQRNWRTCSTELPPRIAPVIIPVQVNIPHSQRVRPSGRAKWNPWKLISSKQGGKAQHGVRTGYRNEPNDAHLIHVGRESHFESLGCNWPARFKPRSAKRKVRLHLVLVLSAQI
jgi:hypothetical protein